MKKTELVVEKTQKPYWFVDAKWIFSLVFMFIFVLTLFGAGLYTLTSEKNGIETMTKMITLSFSRESIDDPKDTDEFMRKLEAAPDKSLKPIPTLNITVSKAELEGKSPREMRYAIFRKIATPIYFNGRGAEEVLNSPEARANFEKDTTLLRIFSEKSHNRIGQILMVLSIVSIIFLGLIAYFSFGFGRIGNPGLIIVLTTWFWAILFTALKYSTANVQGLKLPIPGEAGTAYGAMIAPLVREILPGIMTIFSRIFIYAFFVGIALILMALISKLTTKVFIRK